MPKMLKSSLKYSRINNLDMSGVYTLCKDILKDYRSMVEDDESLPVCDFKWSGASGFSENQLFSQEEHVKFYGAIMKEEVSANYYFIYIFFKSDTNMYCSFHTIYHGGILSSFLYDEWSGDSCVGEAYIKLTELKNHAII